MEWGLLACRIAPVGASLLAKASCQSTSILKVMTLSRASSLPQGAVHNLQIFTTNKGQQIRVNRFGLRRRHPMRKPRIRLQRAIGQ